MRSTLHNTRSDYKLPRQIGYLMKIINDRIKVNVDSDLKEHNLTLTQSKVLAFLNGRGGSATQKEIENFLNVKHPTVVGVVARMEQNGFLRCRLDSSDKRNKIVALTEDAESTGRDMEVKIEQFEQKMKRGLSDEQVDSFVEMLEHIYRNLSE